MSRAAEILRKGAQHIEDRAAARDQPTGERSMARTVGAFNALTGHALTERDGWLFMVALKAARACASPAGVPDDYEDMAAYAALAGESVAVAPPVGGRSGPVTDTWTHPSCPVPIPSEYAFAAQDSYGEWWAYDARPTKKADSWNCAGAKACIACVEPNRNWYDSLICRDEVPA